MSDDCVTDHPNCPPTDVSDSGNSTVGENLLDSSAGHDWQLCSGAWDAQPIGHAYLARLVANGGDLARAESMLMNETDSDPEAYRVLAAIRMRQGRWEEAEAAFRAWAEADSSDPRPMYHLGSGRLGHGRYREAAEGLRAVVQRGDDSAATWLLLGDALAGSGQPEEALSAWRRSASRTPPDRFTELARRQLASQSRAAVK